MDTYSCLTNYLAITFHRNNRSRSFVHRPHHPCHRANTSVLPLRAHRAHPPNAPRAHYWMPPRTNKTHTQHTPLPATRQANKSTTLRTRSQYENPFTPPRRTLRRGVCTQEVARKAPCLTRVLNIN